MKKEKNSGKFYCIIYIYVCIHVYMYTCIYVYACIIPIILLLEGSLVFLRFKFFRWAIFV